MVADGMHDVIDAVQIVNADMIYCIVYIHILHINYSRQVGKTLVVVVEAIPLCEN